MVLEYSNEAMEKHIKANGSIINLMAKENFHGKMEVNLLWKILGLYIG